MIRALALVALVAACGPPKQADTILVVDHQGLAARMRMLCRLGMDDSAPAGACDKPAGGASVERAAPSE